MIINDNLTILNNLQISNPNSDSFNEALYSLACSRCLATVAVSPTQARPVTWCVEKSAISDISAVGYKARVMPSESPEIEVL